MIDRGRINYVLDLSGIHKRQIKDSCLSLLVLLIVLETQTVIWKIFEDNLSIFVGSS